MSEQFYEIDAWVENTYVPAFESYLLALRAQDIQLTSITKRETDTRYSVTFRSFEPVNARTCAYWEIKNECIHYFFSLSNMRVSHRSS